MLPYAIFIAGASLAVGFFVCKASYSEDSFAQLRKTSPDYAGVYFSAQTPTEVISGETYSINLTVEELEGRPRIINAIWINGFYLTRAVGFVGTDPAHVESEGNPSEGWKRIMLSLPIDAYEQKNIELYGTSGVAGPAHGVITLEFEDKSRARTLVRFEVVNP